MLRLFYTYILFLQEQINDLCSAVRATTRSGYVITRNVIGPDRNQNIDLTAKGLSSTEMSQQRALWLWCSLKKSNSM